MRSIFFLFFYLIINSSLSPQKDGRPINYRFKNGEVGLSSYLTKNIKYPKCFIENGTVANSITRVSVDAMGIIDSISIINPIDSIVDDEIINVLRSTKSLWKVTDTTKGDDIFYIQLAFSTKEYMPNVYYPNSKELKRFFLKPIIIMPPEPIGGTVSKNNENERKFITSEMISQKLNSLIDSAKFENALPYLRELIMRDPFNRDLYKARIMINIRLGNKLAASRDDNILFDFAEGYSLDEIIQDNNHQ